MYRSFGELAYLCFGRSSVFIINFVVLFATFAIIVMYSLLFSKIAASLFTHRYPAPQSISLTDYSSYFNYIISSKTTYCLLLYMLLLPTVLKKNLRDLRIQSYLLFAGVGALIA